MVSDAKNIGVYNALNGIIEPNYVGSVIPFCPDIRAVIFFRVFQASAVMQLYL